MNVPSWIAVSLNAAAALPSAPLDLALGSVGLLIAFG